MATMNTTGSLFTHLVCSGAGERHEIDGILTFCPAHQKTLVAQYNTAAGLSRDILAGRATEWNMWRYREMLPVKDSANIVSCGEGATCLERMDRISERFGIDVFLKDEAINPGNSFKSRGQSAAISMAKESGVQAVIIPTAGNAGSAMAQYAARAGMEAIVYMPKNTPRPFRWEAEAHGATVHLVDGSIADCGAEVKRVLANETNMLDVSTFFEPFRLEGKKTMGYEIAEQMAWRMPDVILYPTGGGTGLVGIWKAAQEMKALGWIDGKTMPRMAVVQMAGCAPVVNSFHKNARAREVTPVAAPDETAAFGLRVPKAFAGNEIMKTLLESKGTAIAVAEGDLNPNAKELMRQGFSVGPESAALLTALHQLHASGWIKPQQRVVMLSTGGPYKYMEQMRLR